MSIPLTINGQTFEYPVNFDEDWGVNATGWAQAVTNGMLQRAGGNFPLLADVNFGASFGLISSYYTSRVINPSTVGTLRLASADPGISFRNNANSGNLILTTDSSDNLLYNGHIVGASGSGSVLSITGTANQVIASSSTGNVTLSLPQSIAMSSSPTFTNLTLGNPLPVGDGGTGVASLTAYAVITGGTSSVNPLQAIASVGTAGQVLTSNGPGALPSFTNATGTGTVNSGTTPNIAYYATSSSILSDSGISRANLFLADGTVNATGAFNLNSHKVTGLTNGSSAQDAVAFTQLSSGNHITAGGITAATITTTQVASNTLTGSTANSGGSAGNLATGTVSTPDLRANAVTQVQSSASSGGTDLPTTVTTQSITTIGGPVLIFATASILNSGTVSIRVTRGGTAIAGGSQGNVAESNGVFSLTCVDTPTAGTYTYNFTATGTSTVLFFSLVLVELRA